MKKETAKWRQCQPASDETHPSDSSHFQESCEDSESCLQLTKQEIDLTTEVDSENEVEIGVQKSKCQSYSRKQNRDTAAVQTKYQCRHCGTSCASHAHLKKHTRQHAGKKNFICEYCNKSLSRSERLKDHVRLHTGERPYKCRDCDKAFTKSDSLKMHVRTHTGEKPYKCINCGKAFSDGSTLKSHIRTHTGNKPFKCNDCGAAFSWKNGLTAHIRLHTCEKIYKCIKCGEAFLDRSIFRRHVRIHTCQKERSSNEPPGNFCSNLNLESASFSQSDSCRMMPSAAQRRSCDVIKISDLFEAVDVDEASSSNITTVESSAKNVDTGIQIVADNTVDERNCEIAFAVEDIGQERG